MNRLILMIAATGLVAGAYAQTGTADLMPRNLSLRLGTGYLFDDPARNAFDNPIQFGIDFNSNFSLIKGSTGYFSFDYWAKSTKLDPPQAYAFMWNQRFSLQAGDARLGAPYYFAGLGAITLDLGGSKTALAGRIGVGTNFSERLFGEVGILLTGEAFNTNANQVSVQVGYRF